MSAMACTSPQAAPLKVAPPSYLSSPSANALISELRPTTLSPPALTHINLLLHELLVSLLSAAQSLNPRDLRVRGIPSVFSASGSTGLRALGRSAVGEAELELRSWYESHPFAKQANTSFPPDGKGRGLVREEPFPLTQAIELLRLRCVALSTLAPQTPPPKSLETSALSAWRNAGGDVAEETVTPCSLWITAILEHVCEHVLSQLSRVVSRDSSVTVAGLHDLYVALCEDESVWGLFKRMRVKDSLESAIESTKRNHQPLGLESPSFPRACLGGFRDASIDSGIRPSHYDSPDTSRLTRLSNGVSRKLSSKVPMNGGHERSDSVLSVNTRTMLGAFGDSVEAGPSSRSPQDEEDEFDALVRSGETMKVSLTPSRLKTFEATASHSSAQNGIGRARLTPSPSGSTPMHRSPEAEPSRNAPPRNGMRSRASSSKLLARGAMTIEEQQDEEDASGPEETRKESLIELLSSAPATQDSPTSRDLSSPGKRTVPAVVLGTPPPVFSEQAQKQTPPSINRPDRNVAMQDTLDVKEVKSKSSAEELADFFKSTAPPISTTPPVATKNKGFKSLMSKVTGKKKDDERAPTPTPTSASQTRLNLPLGEAIPPRRRKSLRNVESDQTSPPSSYRLEDTPPVPNRGILRKRSRDAGLPGTAVGGPQSYSAVTEAGDGIASGPESSTSSPIQPTSPAHSNSVGVSNQQSPRRVASSTEDPSPAAITLDPPTDSVSSVPALEDQHTRSMPVLLTPAAGAILQPERTPTFSDANSFQTAEEGEEPLDERKSVGGTDTATEMGQFASIPDRKRSASWEATAPPAPSIPLTDLVPLRHLLQHATSAFECRLLLSAILTQWGVPQSPSGCNTTEPTPESRVTAWLLSGREGPIVGDTPSSSTFSKIDDEIVTPTQNYSALLPSAPTAPVRKSNEEEILSSETTSEASLSGEELREGLPPRTAKSAQRSSPIVLQPVAGGRDLPGAVDVSTNRGMISAGI